LLLDCRSTAATRRPPLLPCCWTPIYPYSFAHRQCRS
jgi:hypothetical protein